MTLRVLEFDRVLGHLAGHTQTPMGARRLRSLMPLPADAAGTAEIDRRQQLHAEATEVLAERGGPGLAGAVPLGEVAARVLAEGAVLEPGELLAVSRAVVAGQAACEWLRADPERWPRLAELAEPLPDLRPLRGQIRSLLTDEGEVRDDASPVLSRMRKQRHSLRSQIRGRLESLVRDDALRDVLRDTLVTERGGRLVVPVRPDQRDKLRGIVHDTSATRQTLFVEPMELVDDQNRLAEMAGEERAEVLRLLTECSAHVRAAMPALVLAEAGVVQADTLQAVARYAQDAVAIVPELGASELFLRAAVHPLADRESFVPLDIEIAAEIRALVITGPNTGGKTVALKTIGTLSLMAQCGLPVPAADARLPRYTRVHADIGDEQSLAANLSTFSGHIANIIGFLGECSGPSLVLLDELGTGTDPAEGAALGIALVERFLALGATVLVSTHHDALKSFAHRHAAAANAAMEFDPDTLAPTYRVRIGRPGRSNALEIATGLGLEPSLIDRARGLLSSDAVQLDEVIRGLESDARAATAEREELAQERRRLAQEREAMRADQERRQVEFETIRGDAVRTIEETVRQIRAEGAARIEELEPPEGLSERTRDDRRAGWGAVAGGIGARATAMARRKLAGPGTPSAPPSARGGAEHEAPLRRGDAVTIAPFALHGTMLSEWDPGQDSSGLEVDIGGKRMICRRDQLAPSEARAKRRAVPGVRASYRRRHDVKPDIDLHGMRVERALEVLDKYLDDAVLAEFSNVRLIHGHGTLRLKHAIHAWLAKRPGVVEYRTAEPEHGGVGVTIVKLGH